MFKHVSRGIEQDHTLLESVTVMTNVAARKEENGTLRSKTEKPSVGAR